MALFFLLFLFILASPLNAEAYIDPGTGSLIIQVVIASIAVGGIYFKKIKGIFTHLFSKTQKNKVEEKVEEKVETTQPDEYEQQ